MPTVVSSVSRIRPYFSTTKVNQPIGNVAMPLVSAMMITRGATVYWQSLFYDPNNNLVTPISATINIVYQDVSGNPIQTSVVMAAGVGTAPWTAQLDTRNFGIGPVYWSIHTGAPVPVSVEDGVFDIVANPSNLVTF